MNILFIFPGRILPVRWICSYSKIRIKRCISYKKIMFGMSSFCIVTIWFRFLIAYKKLKMSIAIEQLNIKALGLVPASNLVSTKSMHTHTIASNKAGEILSNWFRFLIAYKKLKMSIAIEQLNIKALGLVPASNLVSTKSKTIRHYIHIHSYNRLQPNHKQFFQIGSGF